MVITHNMASMNANRQLDITAGRAAGSAEKLSSGYRINRAADDAAGLQISEKCAARSAGLPAPHRTARTASPCVRRRRAL